MWLHSKHLTSRLHSDLNPNTMMLRYSIPLQETFWKMEGSLGKAVHVNATFKAHPTPIGFSSHPLLLPWSKPPSCLLWINPVTSQLAFLSGLLIPYSIYCRFFDDSHAEWCKMLFHCGLIYVSLIISDVEHLLMCLLATYMSSSEKCLFRSSVHFFFWYWILWAGCIF